MIPEGRAAEPARVVIAPYEGSQQVVAVLDHVGGDGLVVIAPYEGSQPAVSAMIRPVAFRSSSLPTRDRNGGTNACQRARRAVVIAPYEGSQRS